MKAAHIFAHEFLVSLMSAARTGLLSWGSSQTALSFCQILCAFCL